MLYFNALLTDYSILNVNFHSIQNFDPYYEIIFKLRYAFETKWILNKTIVNKTLRKMMTQFLICKYNVCHSNHLF